MWWWLSRKRQQQTWWWKKQIFIKATTREEQCHSQPTDYDFTTTEELTNKSSSSASRNTTRASHVVAVAHVNQSWNDDSYILYIYNTQYCHPVATITPCGVVVRGREENEEEVGTPSIGCLGGEISCWMGDSPPSCPMCSLASRVACVVIISVVDIRLVGGWLQRKQTSGEQQKRRKRRRTVSWRIITNPRKVNRMLKDNTTIITNNIFGKQTNRQTNNTHKRHFCFHFRGSHVLSRHRQQSI